ncbi:putative non-specific serine/threonine protein kinase [Helianthus annuus]|nr:putative non-specific serine/threonine protein kinase [Helianthus annuus]
MIDFRFGQLYILKCSSIGMLLLLFIFCPLHSHSFSNRFLPFHILSDLSFSCPPFGNQTTSIELQLWKSNSSMPSGQLQLTILSHSHTSSFLSFTRILLASASDFTRWSLGAITYEMLIVNKRTDLKFRDEAKLSLEAKKLFYKLLCNVEKRLGTKGAHEIKVHPCFKGIEWEKLYQMEAAFIPEVNGELDTQSSLKRLIL